MMVDMIWMVIGGLKMSEKELGKRQGDLMHSNNATMELLLLKMMMPVT